MEPQQPKRGAGSYQSVSLEKNDRKAPRSSEVTYDQKRQINDEWRAWIGSSNPTGLMRLRTRGDESAEIDQKAGYFRFYNPVPKNSSDPASALLDYRRHKRRG